jgi:MFS family permease
MSVIAVATSTPRTLVRRLLPFLLAMGAQGIILWVPVEKLFMTQIGFDAGSVALMAAAYAAVVPLLQIPAGMVADRWSRNGILAISSVALVASSLLGGLSTNVATYVVAAMILGVYFALQASAVDSIVYDTVLEETGSSDIYETWIGRVRIVESGALVVSALAGGVIAGWTSPRLTYFLTIPFVALAIFAFLRFDEPRLHRASERVALRRHVALTLGTMTRQPNVRQVLLLAALVALLSQAVFEFGPLWLVSFKAPAALYGPYWAALVSTLGIGGYLTSKLNLDRRTTVLALALIAPAAAFALALSQKGSLIVVISAQALLALSLAIVGIHAGRLLHDGVPSAIRAGVSAGVGTLSWVLFLPFSIFFGWFAREHGVRPSGWLLATAALLVGLLLVASIRRPASSAGAAPNDAIQTSDDFACQDVVEVVTDSLDGALPVDRQEQFDAHLAGCDGCTEFVRQIRTTAHALETAGDAFASEIKNRSTTPISGN